MLIYMSTKQLNKMKLKNIPLFVLLATVLLFSSCENKNNYYSLMAEVYKQQDSIYAEQLSRTRNSADEAYNETYDTAVPAIVDTIVKMMNNVYLTAKLINDLEQARISAEAEAVKLAKVDTSSEIGRLYFSQVSEHRKNQLAFYKATLPEIVKAQKTLLTTEEFYGRFTNPNLSSAMIQYLYKSVRYYDAVKEWKPGNGSIQLMEKTQVAIMGESID